MRDHLDLLTRAMADSDTDVLMLGRSGNSRWVTGAESLSLSGTRPFAPGCVVVREPASVHLLSNTDEGVPPTSRPRDLFPISWNPMNLMGALAAIPGVPEATRIGVDSITPTMEQLLGATFPNGRLVDGESLIRAVRRVKSNADVDGIRAAIHSPKRACARRSTQLAPGVRERELVGVFEEHMAAHGEPRVRRDVRRGRRRRALAVSDGALAPATSCTCAAVCCATAGKAGSRAARCAAPSRRPISKPRRARGAA